MMSESSLAVTTEPQPAGAPATNQRPLFLALALGFVLVLRLVLYAWMPDRPTDFDSLYNAAVRLIGGDNPYPMATEGFPYPLPAVLLALPFTALPLGLARPIFDVLVGWAFAYALWRHRGQFALFAVLSGAYLFAMWHGQTTPLMVAACLVPVLGFLLAVRPNTSAALWISRPSRITLLGAAAFLLLSILIQPSWPEDWWLALQQDPRALMPPVMRPLGPILLLAALRWRLPEARLFLAIALIPQTMLPYELVSLALIPAGLLEMVIYVTGTWLTVVVAERIIHLSWNMVEWTAATWPATLGVVYLPMLYLVLRRPSSGRVLGKERRRAHRLPDHELEIDVTAKPSGGFTAKVTHLPTQRFATESGRTRELAARKAHDKLAGMLAGMSRLAKKALGGK
jgi:hypothetical protein